MGLGEWWLTHGPGSPGSIARAMAKAYVNLKRANPGASRDELLRLTLMSRYVMSGGLDESRATAMLESAGGRLGKLTILVWLMEVPQAMDSLSNAPDVYSLSVQIIEKETARIAPEVS